MTAADSAIAGIDHALIGVRDLEAARVAWQRLGFNVTPRGRHIGWGTGNYCIMLERGYIELLGVVDPAQGTNGLDTFLAGREGLLGLAFRSRDNDRTAQWL
ncbi:MAG: VOC family protein, partial [Dongiaceae bacterium]